MKIFHFLKMLVKPKNMDKLNTRLQETNYALSALARNIDEEKNLFEKKIHKVISTQIMPIISKLRNRNACRKCHADLGVMANFINNLTPDSKRLQQRHDEFAAILKFYNEERDENGRE